MRHAPCAARRVCGAVRGAVRGARWGAHAAADLVGSAQLGEALEDLHLRPPDLAHQVAALEAVDRHLPC
eukprot:4224670-Prymnesium_polylepis.1